MKTRIGYSFWGFLGDYKMENGKHVSTPDGNATYSWSIIWECMQRRYDVIPMQTDRDKEAYDGYRGENFRSFSWWKRFYSYIHLRDNGLDYESSNSFNGRFPELDVLLLEWRFPIPGRNTKEDRFKECYQPDLERQISLLNHYKNTNTKIIFWDLDHKLTEQEERCWEPDAIFETSVSPRHLYKKRERVEPPIITEDLIQFKSVDSDENRKLVYVGSRYERDDIINEFIKPFSEKFKGQVEFWGNWLKTIDEVTTLWPYIKYNRRITLNEFRDVYSTSMACPLLGKKTYFQTGFITPRPWEALLFGSIPIGFSDHLGINDYVLDVVEGSSGLIDLFSNKFIDTSAKWKDIYREELAHKLSFMDAKYFVDKLERVL